jgi:hypothetical protein
MFCAHAPGYYLTFVSFALFDLSNRTFSKKSIFTCCSVLIMEFFREVATVDNVLIDVVLELKLNQRWIYYLA